VTYTLGAEDLDAQFDEERQLRGIEVELEVDTDIATFTESGVDLLHGDRISDGFTDVTVFDDGTRLQVCVTYTQEDGGYMPDEPTGVFDVAEVTVDVRGPNPR